MFFEYCESERFTLEISWLWDLFLQRRIKDLENMTIQILMSAMRDLIGVVTDAGWHRSTCQNNIHFRRSHF